MIANDWTMGELASETGGDRISGTNDLSKAIAHAIDNGFHFYTLSYTPSNPNMDGQFRSIEVSIPEAGTRWLIGRDTTPSTLIKLQANQRIRLRRRSGKVRHETIWI